RNAPSVAAASASSPPAGPGTSPSPRAGRSGRRRVVPVPLRRASRASIGPRYLPAPAGDRQPPTGTAAEVPSTVPSSASARTARYAAGRPSTASVVSNPVAGPDATTSGAPDCPAASIPAALAAAITCQEATEVAPFQLAATSRPLPDSVTATAGGVAGRAD